MSTHLNEVITRYATEWHTHTEEERAALDTLAVALGHAAKADPTPELFDDYVAGRNREHVRELIELVGASYKALRARANTTLEPEDLAYVGLARFEDKA